MSPGVLLELLAVFAVIGVGWVAGRTGMLGPPAATTLGGLAFGVFVPALLFRTTAGVSLAGLPWATVAGYYVPTLAVLLLGYAWHRIRHPVPPALPTTRALSMSFGNSVQVGIPVAAALFGAAGLAVHIALTSLQSLVLLTTSTVLVEIDLVRYRTANPPADGEPGMATTRSMPTVIARRAVIHPVVLPVLLGLAYNATGWSIPGPVDEVLTILGQAVIPVSLITIGLTLAEHEFTGSIRRMVARSLGKLVIQPAIVLLTAYSVFGVRGLSLTVAVMFAALPVGSNVLLFAQRYDAVPAEVTATIVTSTVAYLITATLWLLLLVHLPQ